MGGLAGNQASKGGKYDTVATIAGALIGGVGAREATGQWDERKRRKEQRENEWEGGNESGRHGRNDKHGDDRYDGNERCRREDQRRH